MKPSPAVSLLLFAALALVLALRPPLDVPPPEPPAAAPAPGTGRFRTVEGLGSIGNVRASAADTAAACAAWATLPDDDAAFATAVLDGIVTVPALRRTSLAYNYVPCIALQRSDAAMCARAFPPPHTSERDFCSAQYYWGRLFRAGLLTRRPDRAALDALVREFSAVLPRSRLSPGIVRTLAAFAVTPADRADLSELDYAYVKGVTENDPAACTGLPLAEQQAICRAFVMMTLGYIGVKTRPPPDALIRAVVPWDAMGLDLALETDFVLRAYDTAGGGEPACNAVFRTWKAPFCAPPGGAEPPAPGAAPKP